jgi:cell division protein ZapA (FtsZ GTPase activity inhibitor)
MADTIPVRVNIADRIYQMRSPVDEEEFVREASNIINKRLEEYRKLGHLSLQDQMAMALTDCMVANLKMERLQMEVHGKLQEMDEFVSRKLVD